MRTAVVAGLLASVLYSQQAVATYGWNDAQKFNSPANTDNQCTGDQSGGYDWGNVPTGNLGSFDGMQFSGFDCQDSFNVRNGKRGLHRRTQFTGKAIVGKATQDDASCPKISSQQKGFSINQMQVSTDKDDTELTFEYVMDGGEICRQKARCGTGGTTVQNTQCGGAKQVKVKGDCNFGFHKIDFDCGPGTPPQPPTGGSTTPVCKSTETLTGGTCAPTPPNTTPASTTPATTTPITTTPTTTTTTTTACKETETPNDKGQCVPTPPTGGVTTTTTPATTTTAACKETETPNGKGECVPKPPTGGVTTTTTPATTTTSACKETETPNDKGQCVPMPPTGGVTTTTTPATTTTAACKETETPNGKGECVPKPPTGGVTTPVTTTGTTTPAATTPATTTAPCKETETPDVNGACVPRGPTGGLTTSPPASSDLVTTEIVVTTLTTCPVTITSGTITSVTQTISTTTITSTATFCPRCGEAPPSTTVGGSQPPPPACKEGEQFNNGKCIPKGPTGGASTPVPTTSAPSCNEGEDSKDGKCVPRTTTTPVATTSAPSCKPNEELKNGQCGPKGPTGGSTTTPSTVVSPAPPGTPIPEAPCPSVLPRCLSTWMQQAGSCSSNSDIKCYCPSPNFISSVQDCVSSWAASDDEVQGALSFLAGICAEFVPQNPGICTGVPSSITLIPTPAAPPAPTSPATGQPGGNAPAPTAPPVKDLPRTVITFTHTITSGSIETQTVTVPQVVFNTITQSAVAPSGTGSPAPPAQGVGLVPALPQVTTAVAGSPPVPNTPVAGATGASTFVPSSTTGLPAGKTGSNSPIQTFTGSASKAGFGAAAGLLALVAFLA